MKPQILRKNRTNLFVPLIHVHVPRTGVVAGNGISCVYGNKICVDRANFEFLQRAIVEHTRSLCLAYVRCVCVFNIVFSVYKDIVIIHVISEPISTIIQKTNTQQRTAKL